MDFDFQFQRYNPSQADIKRAAWDPAGPVLNRLNRNGTSIVAAARAQVGKQTGDLARSIHYEIRRWNGLPELWIGSDSNIALIHHEGTRPHAISARPGAFLRFSARGRVVYARTVMHPGIRPNRFLTDNLYLARM